MLDPEMGVNFRLKGWHSRGYLPHLDAPNEIQALTFRLADALPAKVVAGWRKELVLEDASSGKREQRLRQQIARFEDAGHGECLLGEAGCAETVRTALLHFDGDRYRLLEWCVMPNHVHVLVHCYEGTPLGEIVKSWKTFTARKIHARLGRKGGLWAVDYHDRYIRDLDHLMDARAYIRNNPVKAGLCAKPEDWQWGSAWAGPDRESPDSPEKD